MACYFLLIASLHVVFISVVYLSAIESEASFHLQAAGSNNICPAMFCNKSIPQLLHLHTVKRERQRVYLNT